jgi:hypothetical protein
LILFWEDRNTVCCISGVSKPFDVYLEGEEGNRLNIELIFFNDLQGSSENLQDSAM